MCEFEHAGDVVDGILHLMLINDERDRAALLREEKNCLRTPEEEFLEMERRSQKYEQAKLQKERAFSLNLERTRTRTNVQTSSTTHRAVSHGRAPPSAPLSAVPKQHQQQHRKQQSTITSTKPVMNEELATCNQPQDEYFVQQHPRPRRRHCKDDRVQTITIARDDPKLARLNRAPEHKRHATIVASRPGSDIHPALRDLPPTPLATPNTTTVGPVAAPVGTVGAPVRTHWVPPPRTSSRSNPAKFEGATAFPATLEQRAQGEIVKRKAVPVRKPVGVVAGERVDEVLQSSDGGRSMKASMGHTLFREPPDDDEAEENSWEKMFEQW